MRFYLYERGGGAEGGGGVLAMLKGDIKSFRVVFMQKF